MRFFLEKIMALLFILALAGPCCANSIRTFGSSSSLPTCPFYGEVVFYSEHKGQKPFSSRSLIWCRDLEHYRFELIDCPNRGFRSYIVRSGTYMYSTTAKQEDSENAQWMCCPVFWMGKDNLEQILRQWRMQDPVLIGIEKLHGMRTEHWHGYRNSKHSSADSTLDLWLCMDSRFPLVLKVAGSSLHWEITHLRLNQPIPSYILTPQVHPKSGFWNQLRMQYRPLWMILVWLTLLLLAFSGLIRALTKKKDTWKKVLSITSAGFAVLSLLWLAPRTDQYLNHLSGLSVLILMGGMVAATLVYWTKRFPIPGNVRMFAGTRWPVAVLTLIAAGVAILIYTGRAQALASLQFGLAFRELPFLPQTLVTVAVHAATWAALEEMVFRGYIIGLLKLRFSSFGLVNLLQAFAFTVEHIPKLLHTQHSGSALFYSLGGIFIFGLIFGSFRLKYSNLGAPWLVHVGYNIGAFYATSAGFYGFLAAMMKI